MSAPVTWADAAQTFAFFLGVAVCIAAHGYFTGRKHRGDK